MSPPQSTFPELFSVSFTNTDASNFVVQDFAVIMIIAAIMLLITYKLKQPMVIGYLLAGIIIGPYTPPLSLVHDPSTVNIFAELGIIMLLFVIGTEFPIAKLKSVGRISIIVALAESVTTMIIVFFIAQNLGFKFNDSIFISLAMSITSTVTTVKILEELQIIKDKSSILILGILIVEDIIAVTALGGLQSISSGGQEISPLRIAISLAIVGAFIGGILGIGSRYLPNIIDKVGKTNDYALLLIVILGLAFGLAFFSKWLGLSGVIGAFLAGVLVAESRTASIARVITVPLRDVFAALFFISIGALINIALIPIVIIPSMILLLSSFAIKFLIVSVILTRAKYDSATSIRTGLGVSSAKGEMSLIIAKGGQDLGTISSSVLPILGVITLVTTFIAPYLIRFGSKLSLQLSSQD